MKSQFTIETLHNIISQDFDYMKDLKELISGACILLKLERLDKKSDMDFEKSMLMIVATNVDLWFIKNNLTFDNYISTPQEVNNLW